MAAFLPETLGENLFPCLCRLLEANSMPFACGSFLHHQSQQRGIFKTFSDSELLPPSSTFKRPTWLYWAHLVNPGWSLYFRTSWLATFIPPTILIPPCHAASARGRVWKAIILPPTWFRERGWWTMPHIGIMLYDIPRLSRFYALTFESAE